jgi:DNA-directed RNA polymerase specialized sigma subunit
MMGEIKMKPIILCNKEVVYYTFEETLKQFDNYLKGQSYKYMDYPYNSYDEAYSECQYVLWRAYEVYDAKSGVPFIAYLKRCVANKVCGDIKKDNLKRENEDVLTRKIGDGRDDKELTIIDTLKDNEDIEKRIANKDMWDKILEGFSDRDIEEIFCKLGFIEESQQDLCRKYNTYKQKIYRNTKKNLEIIKKRLTTLFGNDII